MEVHVVGDGAVVCDPNERRDGPPAESARKEVAVEEARTASMKAAGSLAPLHYERVSDGRLGRNGNGRHGGRDDDSDAIWSRSVHTAREYSSRIRGTQAQREAANRGSFSAADFETKTQAIGDEQGARGSVSRRNIKDSKAKLIKKSERCVKVRVGARQQNFSACYRLQGGLSTSARGFHGLQELYFDTRFSLEGENLCLKFNFKNRIEHLALFFDNTLDFSRNWKFSSPS